MVMRPRQAAPSGPTVVSVAILPAISATYSVPSGPSASPWGERPVGLLSSELRYRATRRPQASATEKPPDSAASTAPRVNE